MEKERMMQVISTLLGDIDSGKINGQLAKDVGDLCAFAFIHLDCDRRQNQLLDIISERIHKSKSSLPQGCVVEPIPIKDAMKPEAFEELNKILKEQQEKMVKWWDKKHGGLRKNDKF